MCSPLLLPESQSDEWVRRTVVKQSDIVMGGERFVPQQFECECQWRQHITPHWRLRTMKSNTKCLTVNVLINRSTCIAYNKECFKCICCVK